MMSSEQLERQTEQNRAEVELTIDELRARLTPGQIVDEIMSYAKDGGRQFTSNLGKQITNNPLPVMLMGAGLAWFMFGRDATASTGNGHYGHQSHGLDVSGMSKRTGERLGQMAEKAGDTMHDAMSGMRHAAASAGEAMSETAHSLEDKASSAYYSASSKVSDVATKVGDKAVEIEQKTLVAARDLIDQVKAQPLMLVGIGLALGAALGTVFPATDLENRVMGDTADEVKREAKQVASEQVEKAKDFASDQMDKAKDGAKQLVEDAVNVPGNGMERPDNARHGEHFG